MKWVEGEGENRGWADIMGRTGHDKTSAWQWREITGSKWYKDGSPMVYHSFFPLSPWFIYKYCLSGTSPERRVIAIIEHGAFFNYCSRLTLVAISVLSCAWYTHSLIWCFGVYGHKAPFIFLGQNQFDCVHQPWPLTCAYPAGRKEPSSEFSCQECWTSAPSEFNNSRTAAAYSFLQTACKSTACPIVHK